MILEDKPAQFEEFSFIFFSLLAASATADDQQK